MNISSFNKCCGCSSCFAICPKSAIEMKKNSKGFYRPVVNSNKCIDCSLCTKVCDFNNENINETVQQLFYGARNLDLTERKESQSGGVFYLLAEQFINLNGAVYGATLEDARIVKHIRVIDLENLSLLQKSKYAASQIDNTYVKVLEDLKIGKYVLFSGTPCQVAGLSNFLDYKRINKERLLTIDFVCHGTPSNEFWLKYIDYLERKHKKKIIKATFRDKEYGWRSHFESFIFEDNTKLKTQRYRDIFYENLTLEECCFNCKYTSLNRISDITIADLWGEQSNATQLKDKNGASLVIINTQNGKEFFERIIKNIEYVEVKKEEIMQPNLKHPSIKPKNYNKFWKDYENKKFKKVINKYPHRKITMFIKDTSKRIQNKLKRTFKKS